jgi:uncharacterized membrane protein YdbT with pleckstrin-like domain
VPELPVPAGPPLRPPARARRRYLVLPVAAGLAAGAAVAAAVAVAGGPALTWAAPVLGAAVGAALGVARWRAAGWWESGGTVAVRSGRLLSRWTTVASIRRLQHRELFAALPARRAGLASVGFAVASGARAAIAHLEGATARDLLARLSPRPARPPG